MRTHVPSPLEESFERIYIRHDRKIERNASLARVGIEKERATLGVGFVIGKRPVPARGIPLRRLDLNHIRPKIAQQLPAIWPRHHRPEFYDPDSVQRRRCPELTDRTGSAAILLRTHEISVTLP